MIYRILIACLIMVLMSCKKDVDTVDVKNIDIEKANSDYPVENIIDFSDYFIVKLDTMGRESLLGDISKVDIYDDKIYLMDKIYSKAVYIFNINGEFNKKVTDIGDGPKDYVELSDFVIDEGDKKLIILDRIKKMIKYYDLDGNFIEYKNLPFGASSMSILPNKDYVFYVNQYFANDAKESYHIFITDRNFKIVNRFYDIKESNVLGFSTPSVFTKDEQGNVLFSPVFNTTLYDVSPDELTSKYKVNFKQGKTINPQDVKDLGASSIEVFSNIKKDGLAYTTGHTVDNGREIFIFSQYKDLSNPKITYYSKKTGKAVTYNIVSEDKKIRNMLFSHVVGAYNGYFISQYSNFSLAKYMDIKKSSLPEKLKDDLLSITDDDNPILIFYKLKDF